MSSTSTITALVSSWMFFFSLGMLPVWGQTEEQTKLVEGAKKEGKLIWYTSTNVTESKPLLDDFEKQYPFIKGEIFRASGKKRSIASSPKRGLADRISTSSRLARWMH